MSVMRALIVALFFVFPAANGDNKVPQHNALTAVSTLLASLNPEASFNALGAPRHAGALTASTARSAKAAMQWGTMVASGTWVGSRMPTRGAWYPRTYGRGSGLANYHGGYGAPMIGSPWGLSMPTFSGTRVPATVNTAVLVQGKSLRTWSFRSPAVQQVQVTLSTEGRPLDADVELWNGPDNTPCKMRVYVENGYLRPFSAVIETPRGPNTVAIKNIGQIEMPVMANVFSHFVDIPSLDTLSTAMTIQGGALRTYPFEPAIDSVQVLLRTDGRPLNARIELMQGPNNNKQIIEVYTEDGLDRPFFCYLLTPGSGNVVRIVNTSPVEFPMMASVMPHSINPYKDVRDASDVVLGGDASV